MSGIENLRSVEHFEDLLQEKAGRLVDVLSEGDIPAAMNLINELYEFRHQVFFQEVGALTRGLHEAIKSVGADVQDSLQNGKLPVGLHDASHSLDYVVELTEKNAHETMDRLDQALSLVAAVEAEGVSAVAGESLTALRSELTDILVSQSYQDIAGQLIKKVIALVTRLEHHLVQLMGMASTVERLTGEPQNTDTNAVPETEADVMAEGPQVKGKNASGLACEQDEVDELLSSLGF
ncbi:MAG: protein phosphatase CheZ [Pontibacterium sp.]